MTLTIPVSEIVEKSNNALLKIHSTWKRVPLGHIVELLNGFAFPSVNFNKSKGFPILRIRDIGKNETDTFYDGTYDPLYIIDKGDLIIGMDGDFNCGRWKGTKALLNQRVCKVTVMSGFYDPEFLDLSLPAYLREINEKTSSVTVKHLSSKSVAEIPVPLPPLPEQHRIVAKIEELFTKLDAGVEALKKVKAQLKRYRQAVLKWAFEGELTREWRETHKGELEPASVLLERIKEERRKNAKGKIKELPTVDPSNLPKLPERWVWARFGQLAKGSKNSIKRGPFGSSIKKAFFVQKGYKVYEQQNAIYDNPKLGNYYINEEKYNQLIDFAVYPGDFIISCSGTIGRISQIPDNVERGIINQALLKISIDHKLILSKYFIYMFQSAMFQDKVLKETRGSAMKNIASVKDIKLIPVRLPPFSEQYRIVDEIERLSSVADEVAKIVEQSLTQAERLRKSILKKAFEGKLVLQDPSDEPAEKLLERIKKEKAKRSLEEKAKKQVKKGD